MNGIKETFIETYKLYCNIPTFSSLIEIVDNQRFRYDKPCTPDTQENNEKRDDNFFDM